VAGHLNAGKGHHHQEADQGGHGELPQVASRSDRGEARPGPGGLRIQTHDGRPEMGAFFTTFTRKSEDDPKRLFTELPRRVIFPETGLPWLCSALHEYSPRVTSGSKPKCREYRSQGIGGQNTSEGKCLEVTAVAIPVERARFYAVLQAASQLAD
jgi:hypothetical protein